MVYTWFINYKHKYYKHEPLDTIVIRLSNKFIKIIPFRLNSNGFFGGWGFYIPLTNRQKNGDVLLLLAGIRKTLPPQQPFSLRIIPLVYDSSAIL